MVNKIHFFLQEIEKKSIFVPIFYHYYNRNMSESIIPKDAIALNRFFANNRDRALACLCHNFPTLGHDEAEDVFQDAAIALYTNIEKGKLQELTCSLFSYFMRICYNQTTIRLRKKGKTVALKINVGEHNFDDEPMFRQEKVNELSRLIENLDTEQRAIEIQSREEKIKECVKNMKEPCNKVLWALYWDNLSHQTIAQMCGFASAAVSKTTASRCRNKFSNFLKENNLL